MLLFARCRGREKRREIISRSIRTALKTRLKTRLSSTLGAQVFGIGPHRESPSDFLAIVSSLRTEIEERKLIFGKFQECDRYDSRIAAASDLKTERYEESQEFRPVRDSEMAG